MGRGTSIGRALKVVGRAARPHEAVGPEQKGHWCQRAKLPPASPRSLGVSASFSSLGRRPGLDPRNLTPNRGQPNAVTQTQIPNSQERDTAGFRLPTLRCPPAPSLPGPPLRLRGRISKGGELNRHPKGDTPSLSLRFRLCEMG